jgi:hypothetical protein
METPTTVTGRLLARYKTTSPSRFTLLIYVRVTTWKHAAPT